MEQVGDHSSDSNALKSNSGGIGDTPNRLRVAEQATGVGVWEWDLTSGRMHYSMRAKEICGFAPDQSITIDDARAVTHPDDLPRTWAMASRAPDPALRENRIYVYRIVRADDGRVRWVKAYGEAVFVKRRANETAVRYFGTLQDITAERERDATLEAQQAKLRLAMDTGQIALWEVDQAAGIVSGSRELNRLCGFPDDATPSLEQLRQRQAPGEIERLAQLGRQIRESGGDRMQTEIKFVWPDGTEKWALMRAQLAPGAESRVFGIMIDITDRKRHEQQLATVNEELLHRLRNLMSVSQAIVDRTLADADSLELARAAVRGRLGSMAQALDFVSRAAGNKVPLKLLADGILAPFQADRGRIDIDGTDCEIDSRLATPLALILHELATNAIKHGALSLTEGRVSLHWESRGRGLVLCWREHGGPAVAPPTRTGGGMKLLRANLLGAPHEIEVEFLPDGLAARLVIKP